MFMTKARLLQDNNFRLLLSARAISIIGDKVHFIALTAYTFHQHRSALDVSIMLMCRAAPGLLFGPIAGVLGDRVNRRLLMISSDIIRALLVLLIPFTKSTGQIYVLVFLMSVLGTQFGPAANAFVAQVVTKNQLKNANVLFTLTSQLTGLVGPVVGGLILSMFGYVVAFILDACSFVISAILVSAMSITGLVEEQVRRGFWNDALVGARRLFSNPSYRFVVQSNVVFMLGAGFLNSLLYVYTARELRASDLQFGLMQSAIAAGAILGSLVGAGINEKDQQRLSVSVTIGLALTGLGVTSMGFYKGFIPVLVFLACIGLGNSVYNIFSITLIQTVIPQDTLGRAMGFLATITTIASLAMMGFAGFLGDRLDVSIILLVAGLGSISYSVMILWSQLHWSRKKAQT